MKKICKRILLFLFCFVILRFVINRNSYSIRIVGNSMDPALRSGQLVTYEYRNTLNYGDIVLLKPFPTKTIVKRVVVFPGDSIGFQDGNLIRNGQVITELYAITDQTTCDTILIPEGMIYVLGDNRSVSIDSRKIGCISIDSYLGTVLIPD